MRGRFLAVGAALGLVFGLGLQAAENAPTSTSTASNQDDPDRVICKKEPITGTRLSKRVCHTAREWEQMRQDAQDIMQQGQTHQNNPSGS